MTSGRPDLLLIGLRATGKSSLGRALSLRLEAEFIDLDGCLAQRHGFRSPGDAFRSMGEARFREVESALLAEILSAPRAADAPARVVALGGGTPTAPGARQLLEQARSEGRVRVVLLSARTQVLAERLSQDGIDRPSLTSLPLVEEIEALASLRLPSYRAVADFELDTSDLDHGASLRALESYWGASRS